MALISVAELQTELAGPNPPVLLDVRWALGGPDGAQEYAAGHLPGAVYVDLETQLSRPRLAGEGRHPLPDPVALQEVLRDAGIGADTRVVGAAVGTGGTGGTTSACSTVASPHGWRGSDMPPNARAHALPP